MKFTTKARMTVLNKEESKSETTGKIGYKIAVMQGVEAGSIGCTDKVFEAVKPMESYVFDFVYDDKYGYMRVTGVDLKTTQPGFGK